MKANTEGVGCVGQKEKKGIAIIFAQWQSLRDCHNVLNADLRTHVNLISSKKFMNV